MKLKPLITNNNEMHGLKKSGGPALKSLEEVVKPTVENVVSWAVIILAIVVCVVSFLELFDLI